MFTIRWKRSALAELASFWTQADSARRQAITDASALVDQQLSRNPEQQGASRPKGRRIFFVSPLGVIFRVDVPGSVLHVWTYE